MGCTLSRRQFEVNPNIEGQDQAALNVMYELGLSKRDIDVMYTAFWDMDADESGKVHFKHQINFVEQRYVGINTKYSFMTRYRIFTGTVQPIELFAYFEVESTTYEQAVFTLFDEGSLLRYNCIMLSHLITLQHSILCTFQTAPVSSTSWNLFAHCGTFLHLMRRTWDAWRS